ncbi:MAG: hypothetical protein EXS55_01535 [Candidatus Magasanikbacteria bacterium]|nr:hypothetical protein [Candidatus Magasanikbacteria bacterium]
MVGNLFIGPPFHTLAGGLETYEGLLEAHGRITISDEELKQLRDQIQAEDYAQPATTTPPANVTIFVSPIRKVIVWGPRLVS